MCCLTFRIDPTLGIRFGLARDRILDAACKVFQQRGMQGASVREIVDVAHTNKMSFYRHFASKDALIAEILPKVAADLWKLSDFIAAKRVDDPGLRLEGLFRAYLSNGDLAIPLGCLFAKVSTTESSTDAAVQKYRVAVLVGIRARFLELAATSGITDAGKLADALILLLAGVYRHRLSCLGKTGPESDAVPIARVLIRSYSKDPESRAVRAVVGGRRR